MRERRSYVLLKQFVYINVFSLVVLALISICSLCLYPTLFSGLSSPVSGVAELCRKLLISGGTAFGISAVAHGVICYMNRDYSFAKGLMWTSLICLTVIYIMLAVLRVDLMGLEEMPLGPELLNLMVYVFLGIMLAIPPALVSALIGWGLLNIWYIIMEYFVN